MYNNSVYFSFCIDMASMGSYSPRFRFGKMLVNVINGLMTFELIPPMKKAAWLYTYVHTTTIFFGWSSSSSRLKCKENIKSFREHGIN